MCGTLKYEGTDKKIGKIVTGYTTTGEQIVAKWLGHVRSEKGTPVLQHKVVYLSAKMYTEVGVPFTVPSGKAIKAYLIYSPNFPDGEGIFISTRDATPEELKKSKHPRHPVLVALQIS